MFTVSSWFIDQLSEPASQPVRKFTIGVSDYSGRVVTWPNIKRSANALTSIKLAIPLENTDGGLNDFYAHTYSLVNSVSVQIGFAHPTSGDELITLYSGIMKDVQYSNQRCVVKPVDRLFDLQDRKIGVNNSPVCFSHENPATIAWTLCTCYGGFSSVESTSNVDINYAKYLTWYGKFDDDSILMNARYEGVKVTEGLISLARLSDSAAWVEGDGRLNFEKFLGASSLDIIVQRQQMTDLLIDVEGKRVVNKAYVPWDYSVESDYYKSEAFAEEAISQNSFGLREEIYKEDTCWYVDSLSAINIAQRLVFRYRMPPKSFDLGTTLFGVRQQIGETVRFVESFYGITSETSWRLMEINYNLNNGKIKWAMDEADVLAAFYLDIDVLDGDKYLI